MSGPIPHVAVTDLPGPNARDAAHDAGTPHHLLIEGVPEQVSAARAFIRQVLGSGHPGIEVVTLLTSELVTNSVEHSDSRLPGGKVAITLRAGADRVRVEVADAGGPAVPTLCRDNILDEGGRGLRLVHACSLAWNYHRTADGTVTWFGCAAEPLP